jgi:hypothetical protein
MQSMNLRRFKLRSMMLVIAFLALVLTVLVQAIELRRAAVRAELIRADAEWQRASATAKQFAPEEPVLQLQR